MGGIAKEYLSPESLEELIEAVRLGESKKIGGGSNVLIAEHSFERVIDLGKFDTSIKNIGGRYRVGASVRLFKLINAINKDGYGGIEYLYSVPGLVGGAVVMNAGRGRRYGQCISDYIEEVTFLVTEGRY